MTIHGAASAEESLYDDVARSYDAVLVVSFGGPEGPDDVLPFLENVTRGRPVPRERLLAVAEHYQHFGGVSPINEQNRALVAALRASWQLILPHCRSIWEIATGIPTWRTRYGRCETTEYAGPWHS